MKVFVFIFFTFFFQDCLSQTTYYISTNGSDNNNGESRNSPWKTLKSLNPGNTYLFKRGDVFYFPIPRINNPTPNNRITIGAYGHGNKPEINLYTQTIGKQWTKHRDKIWKIDLRNKNNFTGFTDFNSNFGFLKVDGKIFANKLPTLNSLANQWDFYTDELYLYVFSSFAPSTSSCIEFSSNNIGIHLSNNMLVRDLKVTGSGGHGVQGSNLKNVTIERVDISEIGGSFLPGFGDGTVRYGNGIEFWNGSENCIVKGCSVTQVYDAAYTLQGIGPQADFRNTIFRENYSSKNEQSFEVWAQKGAPGFTACRFIQNKCINAGYGWSHNVRPFNKSAVHILSYHWEVINSDILIEGNFFCKAKSGLYYYPKEQSLPSFVSKNNKIYLDPATPIRSLFNTYTIENPAGFINSTGKEVGSVFKLTSSY